MQIQAKMIARHPVKHEIFAVYDKSEIEVIWLDPSNFSQVEKYMVFSNGDEIKTIEFTKDSLICVLNTNGFIKIYNYNIEERFRGSFHPYMNSDETANPETAKMYDCASSIF